jgi:hypothetical protein
MFERTQSFGMNGMEYKGIQIKIENILNKDLNFSTNTIKLGESLLRITYFDEKLDREKQKNNRITILQEPEKRVYIQIKGQLKDYQVEQIWQKLEKDLEVSKKLEEKKEIPSPKEEIIVNIIESIKLKGYIIDKTDARNFLVSFQEKYDRLPINQEITSIVKGYIIMKNEDYLLKKSNQTTFKEDNEFEMQSNSYNSSVVVIGKQTGRRKCPSCGNAQHHFIYEEIDKSHILMDYPRIYGKKYKCGKCGTLWRKED